MSRLDLTKNPSLWSTVRFHHGLLGQPAPTAVHAGVTALEPRS